MGQQGQDETQIEVSDTGVGIPAEDLPRIFDRFHQVRSNAANQTSGCRHRPRARRRSWWRSTRDGSKWTARFGTGTTFRVVLPVEQDMPESEPNLLEDATWFSTPAAEEPFEKAFRSADRTWRSFTDEGTLPVMGKAGTHGAGGRRRDRTCAATSSRCFRRTTVSVQTQHGGNVKDLVAEHEPSVVLLDWMMPVKDGSSVCRELRTDRPQPRSEDRHGDRAHRRTIEDRSPAIRRGRFSYQAFQQHRG